MVLQDVTIEGNVKNTQNISVLLLTTACNLQLTLKPSLVLKTSPTEWLKFKNNKTMKRKTVLLPSETSV